MASKYTICGYGKEGDVHACTKKAKKYIDDVGYCVNHFKKVRCSEECPICLDVVGENKRSIMLDCGHLYHVHCIERWVSNNNLCPYCRTSIPPQMLYNICKTTIADIGLALFQLPADNRQEVINRIYNTVDIMLQEVGE